MDEPPALDSHSLTEKLVLLAIADAVLCEETPVASVDIRPRCEKLLEHVDAAVVSPPGESDIMRALSVLGAEPYVDEVRSGTSPTGKGRPQYGLDTDPDTVLAAFEEDDQLGVAVEFVGEH